MVFLEQIDEYEAVKTTQTAPLKYPTAKPNLITPSGKHPDIKRNLNILLQGKNRPTQTPVQIYEASYD